MSNIVRIAQSQYVKKGNFDSAFEVFDPDTKQWTYTSQVYRYFSKAKVRIDPESAVVFLIGIPLTSPADIDKARSASFIGLAINWSDTETTYKYLEFLDYFEAYI